jgi:hypothetical protein
MRFFWFVGEVLVRAGYWLQRDELPPEADQVTVTRRSRDVGFTEHAEQMIESGMRARRREPEPVEAPLRGSLAAQRAR